METSTAPVTFSQALRNRQFFALWLAQFVSSFGDWLAILAIFSLMTFRWEGTPGHVAGIFIAFASPFAFLGPLAGVFVDRWNLKRTMIASDLVRAVLAFGLMFASEFWHVYVILFLLSAVSAFFLPAQSSIVPLLVRKEELLVANALNAQSIHLTKIVGPALGGVIVASAGELTCFLLDGASFVASAALLTRIHATRLPAEAVRGVGAVLADLREGVVFLATHAALRFVVLATVATIFAVGVFDALIAIYVRDILNSSSRVFGVMIATIGVGTIVGSTAVGKFAQRMSRVQLVAAGIGGCGFGVALLAMASSAPAALAASLFLGLTVAAVFIPSQALTQEETPAEMLGRVSATSIAMVTVSQLVGVAVSGKLAGWFGIRNLYYGVAVAIVLVGVVGYGYARANRVGEKHEPASAPASPAV